MMRRVGVVILAALALGLGLAAVTPGNAVYDAVRSTVEPVPSDAAEPIADEPTTPEPTIGSSNPSTDGPTPVAATDVASDATASPVAPSAIGPPPGTVRAVATLIKDGDSFEVSWPDGRPAGVNRDEIRLQNINTPEFGDCHDAEAKAALVDLIDGKTLDVDIVATERNDGRQIADVWVDGVFVNLVMLDQGHALALSFDSPHLDAMRSAQLDAQARPSGMWASCVAFGDLGIADIESDPRGRDEFAMNEEWVAVVNLGATPADLSGYMLRDESTFNRFRFPDGFTLDPGDEVLVRSGDPDPAYDGLFWEAWDPVWNNSGDTAYLIDPNGLFVDWLSY